MGAVSVALATWRRGLRYWSILEYTCKFDEPTHLQNLADIQKIRQNGYKNASSLHLAA